MSYCCQLTANYFGAAEPSFETVAHVKVQDCQKEAATQKQETLAEHRKLQGHKLLRGHLIQGRISFTCVYPQ